jgi:peptidoglycan/LPS O-acetylase OafA/YrhL
LSWSIGAYLAECFITGRTSRLSKIGFDKVAIAAILIPVFKPTSGFTFLAFALLTGIAIDRLITEKWSLPNHKPFQFLWSHLSFLGIISYSFYLFHQPILMLLTKRGIPLLWPQTDSPAIAKFILCWIAYPFIIALSYLVYRLVERPSISIGKRLWKTIQ